MSPAVFLPLLLFLGLCLVPVWLLSRQRGARAQDSLISPGYVPPEAIRNASIAASLRLAMLAPVLLLGATGEFWPVIVAAASSAAGIYLIYLMRRRLLPFLENAIAGDRSITVHAFIAQECGGDRRVGVIAAGVTLLVLMAVIACEAFALYGFFALFANDAVARGIAFAGLLLAVLYAVPAGHPGVIQSGQFQLGAMFLALFAAGVLLLYQYVSALTPAPSYTAAGIGLAAICCVAILIYRRSRYVETGPVDSGSRPARLLGKFGKALNPVISVFVVLVIVLAGMAFSATTTPSPAAAADPASSLPLIGFAAIILLPLLYPLADIVHWQKLAAIERNRPAYQGDTARWLKALRGIFRIYALEKPSLWLFIASLGAISVAALAPSDSAQVLQALVESAAAGDNPFAAAAFSLLLAAVAMIGAAAMAAAFSAGLCTIHYDIVPVAGDVLSGNRGGRLFFLAVVVALIALVEISAMSFTSIGFLALVFAFLSPLVAFVPLILGPAATGRSVNPAWAGLILIAGIACAVGGLFGYAATGNDSWLWVTVPASAGLGVLLFAAGAYGSRIR